MPEVNIDFEGNASPVQQQGEANNANGNQANEPDRTDLHNGSTDDITGKSNQGEVTPPVDNNSNNTNGEQTSTDNNGQQVDNSSTGDVDTQLESGTEIEYDGNTYTVADNGNLVDKDGKVFKEAKDVQAWLKENGAISEDENTPLSMNSIRDAIGIDVTDENGQPVQFTDDAEGVKSYIESVINLKSAELQQGAINKLYADNPLLKQFVDYVKVTGTPRGFGDIPDRSGIQLDRNNIAQLKAVIRMAAEEFGNKSLNDNYIKYLEDSGALYDEAKSQLEALVGKDKAYKQEIEKRANAAREQEERELEQYWNTVSNAINNGIVGNYKIPESFVKEVNGQKITLTRNDFYNYLSKATVVDEEGNRMTGYQRDLDKLSDAEVLNRELLDAWLMFTGGSYKDLISMAVKEDAVRKLVIKSKQQRPVKTIKVNKPQNKKFDAEDILLV